MCDEYIISGPEKPYTITFDSLGKYLFECLKKRDPDEVFGVDVGEINETITCGTLLQKSITLSKALKKYSVTKDVAVALVCESNIKSFVCLLALTYLGVRTTLVNSVYTIRELKHIFGISKPKCVICAKSSLNNILKWNEELHYTDMIVSIDKLDEKIEGVVDVDTLCRGIETNFDEFLPVETNRNDVILLFLSSGTTGLPKCVQMIHENFIGVVDYTLDEECINAKSTDTIVTVLPLFHIYGSLAYFGAVISSMKLIVLKSFKPKLFLETIQKFKATKLYTVPPLLQFLATSDMVESSHLSSLKDIIVGGAPVGFALYKEASEKLRSITIRELYGVTELCGICTIQHSSSKAKNAGKLINNLQIKVVDPETKKPLPAYKTGEIHIKGIGRMKGYLNNPVETENAIGPDGFYRSGDMGYYDENGHITISGRLKELIKYKAFQVAPVELENVIFEHPAIKDCAVFGRAADGVGELSTALLIVRDGFNLSEEEILNFVAERLSPQKHLHGGAVFVNEIPRNATGKILRRELPKFYDLVTK